MSFFTAENLSAGYGSRKIIEGVSFSLEGGTLTGVLGANGSGKTTLLKALCGILPHQGHCTLEGQQLEGLSPRQLGTLCGYIPQRSGLFLHLPVEEVVLMGFNPRLGLLQRPGAREKALARQALAQVGLEGMEGESYLTLSEGQKQLCILARALAASPRLFLLDEPESALDPARRWQVLELLTGVLDRTGAAGLVVLHDPALALNFCHQLLLIGEGKLLGSLDPRRDSPQKMEEALSRIYGPVTLTRSRDKTGREHLVLLNEWREDP